MRLFDHENYNSFMYLAISIVSLLIIFNFVNILENNETENQKTITSLAISDIDYSKGYLFYYLFIGFLGFFIALTTYKLYKSLRNH